MSKVLVFIVEANEDTDRVPRGCTAAFYTANAVVSITKHEEKISGQVLKNVYTGNSGELLGQLDTQKVINAAIANTLNKKSCDHKDPPGGEG